MLKATEDFVNSDMGFAEQTNYDAMWYLTDQILKSADGKVSQGEIKMSVEELCDATDGDVKRPERNQQRHEKTDELLE